MDLSCARSGGGMKTLNRKGHQERRKLIREGAHPEAAYRQALQQPENHSRFKQGRKNAK